MVSEAQSWSLGPLVLGLVVGILQQEYVLEVTAHLMVRSQEAERRRIEVHCGPSLLSVRLHHLLLLPRARPNLQLGAVSTAPLLLPELPPPGWPRAVFI